MGTVSYNGKKLIPAPFASITKSYSRSGDGHKIGGTFNIVLAGELISYKGSPGASGFNGLTTLDDKFWVLSGYPPDQTDNGLTSLLVKQEALRHLFSQDGKSLEIQCGGATPCKCYPRVLSVEFPQGNWAQRLPYIITVDAAEVFGLFDSEDYKNSEDYFVDSRGNKLYISEADENWNLETQEQGEGPSLEYTYRLTHGLNAVGQRVYVGNSGIGIESDGWEQARDWVVGRAGLDTNFLHGTSGINLPSYYQALNHVVTESPNKLAGSYNLNETWVVASGNVMEDCNISLNDSENTSMVSVSIEGSIQGLNSISKTKYQAAQDKWTVLVAGGPTHDLFKRAQMYSGITLNSTPKQYTKAVNPVAGNINYTFQYDNSPSNYVTGAKYETLSINDTKPVDVVGSIVVPGRASGPVLQDMGTITEYSRSLNIEVVMPHYSGVAPTTAANVAIMLGKAPTSQVQVIINAFDQNLRNSYNQVFVTSDIPNWNPKTGQYSRNVTWLYQDCILSAVTPPFSGAI